MRYKVSYSTSRRTESTVLDTPQQVEEFLRSTNNETLSIAISKEEGVNSVAQEKTNPQNPGSPSRQ